MKTMIYNKDLNLNSLLVKRQNDIPSPGAEVIRHYSFLTQLSLKFILLINVQMPTVGIFILIGLINDCFWDLNLKFPTILAISIFMIILDFMLR